MDKGIPTVEEIKERFKDAPPVIYHGCGEGMATPTAQGTRERLVDILCGETEKMWEYMPMTRERYIERFLSYNLDGNDNDYVYSEEEDRAFVEVRGELQWRCNILEGKDGLYKSIEQLEAARELYREEEKKKQLLNDALPAGGESKKRSKDAQSHDCGAATVALTGQKQSRRKTRGSKSPIVS